MRHPHESVSDLQTIYEALGGWWVQGGEVDWTAFYAGEQRRRVPLPTYPFEGRRCWISAGQPTADCQAGIAADPVPAREPDLANWFYRPSWASTEPPAPSSDVDGDLLVFDDDTNLGQAVADELLLAAGAALHADERPGVKLEFPTPGEPAGARLAPLDRREPGPGEVEIAVRTAALNFADALKVSGTQPDAPFGVECAGVVLRLGEGVSHVAAGDEVVAVGPDSFQSHVVRDARLVAKKPVGMSWQDAVTLPAAFMTVVHALDVGQLAAGERLLIHAASGGVGLAAVQVAQARGAEIFATAGSPEKRALLQSLGIRHVFHSRTLDFADEIRARTGGMGVDVVLDSLTGDFLTRSLRLLAPQGRFLELGKKETYSADQLAALQLAAGVSYHAIDLSQIMRDDPARYGLLLADVVERAARGELKPLPSRLFPAAEAAPAFDLMIRAQHTGKIVLDFAHRTPQTWIVEAGESFRRLGPNRFAVNPARAADYASLFEALGESARSLRRVLHRMERGPARPTASAR